MRFHIKMSECNRDERRRRRGQCERTLAVDTVESDQIVFFLYIDSVWCAFAGKKAVERRRTKSSKIVSGNGKRNVRV